MSLDPTYELWVSKMRKRIYQAELRGKLGLARADADKWRPRRAPRKGRSRAPAAAAPVKAAPVERRKRRP